MYDTASLGNDTGFAIAVDKTRRRHRLLLVVALVAAIPIALWQAAILAEDYYLSRLKETNDHSLALYVTTIRGELGRFKTLPKIVSNQSRIVEALRNPKHQNLALAANRLLLDVRQTTGAAAAYLMDKSGLTIAADNWNTPGSFVGRNFGFRPYFQDALEGRLGRYFALGTTTLKRGYYFASPVRSENRTLGAVVVKVEVSTLEETWRNGGHDVLVIDPKGVVFLTSRPEWRYRTLTPLPPEALAEIRDSRQYHDAEIGELPVTSREHLTADSELLTIRTASNTIEFLSRAVHMPEAGWTVHVLTDTAAMRRQVTVAVSLTGLFYVLVAVIVFGAMERRADIRLRLATERDAKEALATAAADLELRVRSRTSDLEESNQRLEVEISERRQAEDELRQTQDELVRAGKLAALGHMSAGISHEINQPLAAIRSYSENALKFLELGHREEISGNLAAITELTTRIADITTHLKTFARQSGGATEPVSLKTAISDALAMLDERIQKERVEVRQELEPADIFVEADLVRLSQVLVNLISNALDAMRGRENPVLEILIERSQSVVRAVVRDSGGGIPEAVLPKIFDPFFSTKSAGEGLGLGLSLSHAIVEDFGGVMRARNLPDGGAEFSVELKRSAAHPEPGS